MDGAPYSPGESLPSLLVPVVSAVGTRELGDIPCHGCTSDFDLGARYWGLGALRPCFEMATSHDGGTRAKCEGRPGLHGERGLAPHRLRCGNF